MYDWKEMRDKRAFLALACGEIFRGYSVGAKSDALGEAVFNTGMTGYQEIITDPSYSGQIVTLTAPEIGNYGVNTEDMESRKTFLNGLIVHEINEPSNFRSQDSLENMLIKNSVPAIAGIDTRRLTLALRSKGTQKAYIHCSDENITEAEAIKKAIAWEGLDGKDYASLVSVDKPYKWNQKGKYHIIAYDFGIKYGILRSMEKEGFQVTVVPAKTSAAEVLAMKADGVFLSNGPADPSAVTYAIDNVKKLIGKTPVMGICLGHQLIGIAMGAECGRLKFGHHGCNHPVKNLLTGEVEITSQNHNFSLIKDSLPKSAELTHINLNDGTVEGIRHTKEPVFCVQYHPEAAPGPNDSKYLFKEFKKMMER